MPCEAVLAWVLSHAPGTILSHPSFGLPPGTFTQLCLPRLSLPILEVTCYKSPSSIELLELLTHCGGLPELVAPSISLLELVAPCGGIPELLALWEVTLMDRFLTTGESLPPIDCSAAQGWL
jgi:hypothetical protein